jgi:hypothetical protein
VFKQGSQYSRADIWNLYRPDEELQAGGNWFTGYCRQGSDLVIFMNIGVAGKTGHDFDNHYDSETQTIRWFGKPKKNSKQPLFQELLSGKLTPQFFARWDNKNVDFTYLGIGKVVHYEDHVPIVDSKGEPSETIRLILTIDSLDEVITTGTPIEGEGPLTESSAATFALEKHLEDFIISNWSLTEFGDTYDVYQEDGVMVGKQYRTDTGPLDILALSKDKNEFLVIELKKGRASDQALGQLQRYMGYVKEKLANNGQEVKGCIVALEDDQHLRYALLATTNIRFYQYQIDFRLMEKQGGSATN